MPIPFSIIASGFPTLNRSTSDKLGETSPAALITFIAVNGALVSARYIGLVLYAKP